MSEHYSMNHEKEKTVQILELEPLGFGNPDAKVRYERIEDPEIMTELKDATAEIIRTGECIVDITEIDDGCIDGRFTLMVSYIDTNGARQTVEVSGDLEKIGHERYKVAGGGYITGLAMLLAVRPPKTGVEAVLLDVANTLAEKGIFCGEHTGPHEDEDTGTTDCGARDREESILETSLIYEDDISPKVQMICETAGANYASAAQTRVNEGWAYILNKGSFFAGTTGASQAKVIEGFLKTAQHSTKAQRPLAVSKRLAGEHNERFIVVNFLEGKTLSQRKLHNLLRERFPDVDEALLPQVFVVDAPRIATLAQNLFDDEADQQVALQAGITYQLGTAATLTDGSLRLFVNVAN